MNSKIFVIFMIAFLCFTCTFAADTPTTKRQEAMPAPEGGDDGPAEDIDCGELKECTVCALEELCDYSTLDACRDVMSAAGLEPSGDRSVDYGLLDAKYDELCDEGGDEDEVEVNSP